MPARGPLAGVLVTGVLGALVLIAQAWVVTQLVMAALGRFDPGAGPDAPLGEGGFWTGEGGAAIWPWALAVAGIFALRGLLGWVGDQCAARAATVVGEGVRRSVLDAVLAGAARRHPTGELAALATRGAAAAEPYLTRYVPALVLAGVLPVLTLVAIALVDPWSALIVLLTLPLIPVFGALVGLATRDKAESQWRVMASLSSHFVDVMRGLPTLVAYRRARAQSRVIGEVTDRYRRRTLETLRVAFASSAVLELVATISVALVAVTVGLRLAHGDMPLDQALVVLLLAPEAYWPLRRVGAEFHAAAEGVATFEAVSALDAEAGAFTAEAGEFTGEAGEFTGEAGDLAPVRLEHVSVTYPGRRAPALAPTSLTVAPCGVTAVTGPSGCGKSTLLAVLAGELEPTSGRAALPPRDRVALLPQRPVFVAGSVADNLRLARPDATEAELWSVLAEVALAERVRELPDGLHTPVGEDGATLSGGERARLALARVVLSDRPWVLLDEPTAHLDPVTEKVVLETVATLGRSRAVVVVAHRPALVALADTVVELAAPAYAPLLTSPVNAPASPVNAPASAVNAPASAVNAPASAVNAPASAGESPRLGGEDLPSRRVRLWGATVLSALASLAGVALTATAGWLIVQSSTMPPVLTLMVAIVGVRTFGLARPVLRYVERLRSHDEVLRLLGRTRVAVYDAVVPLTPGGLQRDGRRRGDVLAAVVDDVDSVLDQELRVRLPVRAYVLLAVLVALLTAVVEPLAVPVVVATAAVAGGLGYALARVGAARAERVAVAARARLSEAVLEVTQTADELARWAGGGRSVDRVHAAAEELAAATTRSARWLGAAHALVLVVAGAAVAVMALVVGPLVGEGTLSGPLMALLVLVPLALAEPAAELADAGALAVRTRAALDRLDELTHRHPVVTDPADPVPAPVAADLALHGVAGGWGEAPAFTSLDLALAPGERVGVVGPSGSGKSTLAALLLRFVDPAEGEVRLGGERLPALALDDVRRRVGLVDDDPHVFASTVAENVRFARPGASDAEVEDALRRAHLGEWLDSLPDGLATRLGDGGASVSGGERARLGLARSLLAEQPVVVLDEPTAHLDHATARALAREVLAPDDGRAVLWITHDPVGLDLVDRVVELG